MSNKNLKTIEFNTIEEAQKFQMEWGFYLKNLNHREFCSYIKNNKEYKYHSLIVPTHNHLVKFVEKSNKNLQMFNEVVLEMFLLSSPK
jgi:hypothetical protein